MSYRDEIGAIVQKRRVAAMEAAFVLFSNNSIEEVNMEDIAKKAEIGVASLYRYFGTKLALCVELGTLKWREYAEEMEKIYEKRGGSKMNAIEEFEFYVDCYVELYENHKPLLRFNSNFDLYAMHEKAKDSDLVEYYGSVGYFREKFHTVYEKAKKDKTIRTDISEQEMFFSVMYTMLPTAQKLSFGLIFPRDSEHINLKIIKRQKEMFMNYVKL